MTENTWQELQALFHRALERPPEERRQFVAEHASSQQMRDEVFALLDAEEQPASVVDRPYQSTAEDRSLEGSIVGAYRLVRQIGSGGMGSVFLAERADGTFERQVALKVVKKGMDTAAVNDRFQRERQILAQLDHPNIATVLDGGVTDDGRPYFVMEYVDGVPITDYCDAQKLSISERLQIFGTVCSAVEYAHKNLVVHRDLKPSNILVTATGEVRLLDFGIAKLLAEESDLALTQTGALLATPAYAAPEQLLGDTITTMTDVYALGVLLYELLAGRRPFEVKRTAAEFKELVLSGEPIRPSTAVTDVPGAFADQDKQTAIRSIADARSAQTNRLKTLLRGDLDTICLTALMREPALRYQSVSLLAGDLTRHLQGLPIVARRQSMGYRMRKFYGRHKLGLVASFVSILVFAGIITYSTIQVAAERDIALLEQAKTEEVAEFVTSLFRAADPAQAKGADVTAREILDAGRQKITTEMSTQPELQATMQRVLGEVYYELGLQQAAGDLLQQALSTQRQTYGEYHLETADSYISLGMQQQTIGNMQAARSAFEKGLSIRQALLGGDHVDIVEGISAQAFLEETEGNFDAAEKFHQQALAMAQRLAAGNEDLNVAHQFAKLASLYRLQDRNDEAEPLLRSALAMQDRLFGGAHPESDETKRQLAELLTAESQFDEAESLFQELIQSRTEMLGPDHYETGAAWNSYGHLLSARGDTAGAIDAYNKMLDITRRAYGDTHPALAAGYNNIAIMRRNLGDFEGALKDYYLCIDMQNAVATPSDHPNRAYPLAGIARVLLLQRQFAAAEEKLLAADQLRAAVMEPTHILRVELKTDLGAVYTELGRYTEASAQLLEAYPLLTENVGKEHPTTQLAAARIVRLYEKSGQPEKAEPYRSNAVSQEDDIMLRYF
jgi:eukaryotic-like serine/threonine-protein kinase